MMRETWLWVLAAAATTATAEVVQTPAPSLICSDVPSRPILEPSPSREPSPTFFIRRNTRGPTENPTLTPTLSFTPTLHPTDVPTLSPTRGYCDGDMLDHLSLVGPAGQTVIPILKDGDVFHRMQHSHAVFIEAVSSSDQVGAVKFTVDGEAVADFAAPFVAERTHLLSVPGEHTLEVQALHYSVEYEGCYLDQGARQFPHFISSTTGGWTASMCSMECAKRGYPYSGSQWYAECFCGTQANFDSAVAKPESECNTACRFDTSQKCGGGWRNSVFKINVEPVGPVCSLSLTTEYDVPGRTCEGMVPTLSLLTGPKGQMVRHLTDGVNTVNMFDNPHGFQVRANAHPEFVTFVKFTIDDEHVFEDHSFPFIADTAEILEQEGPHTIKADSIKIEFERLGCFLDGGTRKLPVWSSGNRYTPDTCAMSCLGRGYQYSGTQWFGYCFCGTQEHFDSNVERPIGECWTPCSADPTEKCGGGYRNSVVKAAQVPQGPTCTVELNTVYEVEGRICEGMVPTLTLLQGGDDPQPISKLTLTGNTVNLIEELEGVIIQADTPAELVDAVKFTVDTDVYELVDSDHPYRLDELDGIRSLALPGLHSLNVQAMQNEISYLGCYFDNNARYFDRYLSNFGSNNLDATGCATECSKAGFPYAGSQAGGYCFCGTEAEMEVYRGDANLKRAESECGSKCAANNDETCGGGWRNSVYQIGLVPFGPACALEIEAEYEIEEKICTGMIPGISLVNTTDNQIVQSLTSGRNVLNMIDFPDGVGVLVHNQPLFVPNLQLTVTESSGLYESYSTILSSIPYVDAEVDKLLALPGTHEIKVEALGYEYVGCYQDHGDRMFGPPNGWIADLNQKWDVFKCLEECVARGFPLSGSQYYGYCFCGTEEELAVATKRPDSECNTLCNGGDTSLACGGSYRNSVYRKISAPPTDECGVIVATVYEDGANKICDGMIPNFSLVSADTGEVIIEKVGKGSSAAAAAGCADGIVKVDPEGEDFHQGRDAQCLTTGAFFCYAGEDGREAFFSTPETQTLTCLDPADVEVTVQLTKISNSEVSLEVLTLGYVMSDVLMKGGSGGANLYQWFNEDGDPRGSSQYGDFVTPNNPNGSPADISHILLCLMEEPECEETSPPVLDVLDMDKWPRGAIIRANAHPEFVPSVVFEIDDEYATLDKKYPFESYGASAILGTPGDHTLRVQPVELIYKGCYVDQSARMFPTLISLWTAQWTATECVIGCRERGFAYAGSQYYGECFCGTQEQLDAAVQSAERDCWTRCKGDETQICGGGWRNSVYSTSFKPLSDVCEIGIKVVYNNEPNQCVGMISSLALINAETDEPVEGKEELAKEGNIVEIEKFGSITVRANTEVAPAVQWSVAGNDHYQTDTMYPFTLSSAHEKEDGGWDYLPSAYLALPGTHEIKVRAINLGYQGCFIDYTDSIRIFGYLWGSWDSGLNALQCKVECGKLGYAYSGSQNANNCFCGTQEEFDDAVAKNYETADGQCNRKCTADETQICGGWSRSSVFATKEDPLSDWCSTEVTTVYKEPPACPGIVSGLTLYDAGTAQALHEIASGTNIVLGDTSGMLTIRAHVPEALRKIVKRIRFELDDITKDDTAFPYYMNGDFKIHGGYKFDPEPRLIVPGSHTLKVYAQLIDGDWEMESRHCAIEFTVAGEDNGPCAGIIQSLALIDAESNGLVSPSLGGVHHVDLASYPGGITVRANTYTTGYQPVRFEVTNLNEDFMTTSYDFPHTLSETLTSGDQRYNYTGSAVIGVPGTHKIKAGAVLTDYKGCYQDFEDRILTGAWYPREHHDVPSCIQRCREEGFAYAGLQWYTHCFCGSEEDFNKPNNYRRPESECDRPCTINSLYTCGGGYRNSIYGTAESEISGEWCEVELQAVVGDGESSCGGAIGGFSIMIVGGGDVQSLFGFNQINGGQYYVMDMENFPSALTVRANLVQSVKEVRFYVNDTLVMTEFVAPYVLGGKANFTDFIYRSDVFSTLGVHEIKAIAVMEGETVEDDESACSFQLEISGLPDEPDDPSVPIYDPKTTVDFLLLAEHRCKPLYVDGTAEGNGFFFKTLGEITDTTFDENVTFTTSNYFTVDEEVGSLDYMTTVYQDAATGEIVCDRKTELPAGATSDEYVGKCDTGNFSYFTVYAFDEHFTEEDNADYSDLPAECQPPASATIGGARKFTFAVPCECSNLDDEIDYGDEIPKGNLVASSWGDPHIVTWDGTRYDCQVVGEVTLFKAKLLDYDWHFGNDDFETHTLEMQMRYQFMDAYFIRDRLVSLGQGFVIKEKKKVQMVVAEDHEGKPRMGDCGIDFYIDDVRTDFLQGIDEDDLIVHPSGSFVYVFFPKTGFNLKAHVRRDLEGDGSIRTCGISVYAGLPMNNPSIYAVTGMWGIPDGYGANDFLDKNDEPTTPPQSYQAHFEFCRDNWCNRDESASLFVYEEGKSFADYQRCDLFDWKGDYDFSLVDEDSRFICSQLGEHTLVEQCKIDALIGGLNYTKQFYLDVQEMNSMQSDTSSSGDSDTACCSSDFKTCAVGDKCNNIWTCDECVGAGTDSVWLHLGTLEDKPCLALGEKCGSNEECCSSGRTDCVNEKCVPNGKDSLRRRRRLQFSGFDGPIVPRDKTTHAVAYHRPVYTKY